jgi:hypothetical protein
MDFSRSSASPCQVCDTRYLGCHDRCEAYKSWKRKTKVESKIRRKFIDGIYKEDESKLIADKSELLNKTHRLSNAHKATVPMNMRPKVSILGIQVTNYGTTKSPLFSKRDIASILGVERLMMGYKSSMLVKKKICSGFSEDILLNVEGVIHTILNAKTQESEELKEKLIKEVFVLSK